MAIAGEILVSGGADEVVKVYDLKKRVERGNLMEHEATITALAFYGTSHLLSASEDGAIHVWDTSRWETLKVLHGHKGAVDSLSIHPSGKLALSVGRDYTLHVWNLIKVGCLFCVCVCVCVYLCVFTSDMIWLLHMPAHTS